MNRARRIQESPWCKGGAALLLVVFSCLAGLFGTFVLRGLLYQGTDSWQDTYRFQNLLQERQAAVAALIADSLAVGQLPLGDYTDQEQWASGVMLWESQGDIVYQIWPDEALSYVQTRQYEQDIATLSARLDPAQTWFRFQVRTADGSFTLGGNLAPGEVLEETADAVYYAGFDMGVDLDEHVPAVCADPGGALRVMTNLLRNALDHGQSPMTIRLYAEGERVVSHFTNAAPDLGPEDARHVFDRFFTSDKMRTGRNTGLGLAIVKTLAEQMEVEVRTELANGNFTIALFWRKWQ